MSALDTVWQYALIVKLPANSRQIMLHFIVALITMSTSETILCQRLTLLMVRA